MATVGAGIGVVAEGVLIGLSSIAKMAKANSPEPVIDMILDFFQEEYTKGDDDVCQLINSFFSVVAQDRTKVEQYVRRTQARFDPNDYRELEYKTMEDVIAAGTRMGKATGKVFFKEDFEEKSDGGCSIM